MPTWVQRATVLAIHDEQLAEHGGLAGLRDTNALDSALARPQQLEAYGEPTIFDLAASYAFGLARNHAFVDGNKRVSFVVAELFLALNGYELAGSDSDVVDTWLKLAAGEMSEVELSVWLSHNARPE